MVRKRVEIEYEDGTQLGRSRDGDGASSPNLFIPGSQGVKGQVKIYDIDEDEADSLTDSPLVVYVTDEYASDSRAKEPSELAELLGALALLGAIVALEKAKPHVKRWWSDQARPAINSMWNRLARTREADSQAVAAESTALMEYAPAESSQEVVATLEAYRASMSSVEARERFVAALVARLFSEEQLRILRNSRIEDEDGPLGLNGVMETLTYRQVEDSITLMLETNPSLLDEETLAEIGKILGGSRVERAPSIEKRNSKEGTTSD
ncbi:hypothetical protein [Streptomyces europaeiscabiei]|uniref:hypothetical protein n=1 Tax=Streptomyces europaeiscabiei TaxID=146819 RepID=UPI0029A2C989|nr:hypothetical protein [Streptomyces europaeiscabiei]MDX3866815.1 hypothetical protein [Streptomyces europaeiscabiei]MDX3873156.1 hypothetical protein [Streptomyces europaeiscabiei]